MSKNSLAARMTALGGSQLQRINKQKLKSFQWALKNDYNSRLIKTPLHSAWPALIVNDVAGLKSNYDKKYVSVEFDAGLESGDVFEILDDGTHWMIYLPILTETAYLRSEIIRCRYTLEIDGTSYWVYFRGPEETDLRWFIKNAINVNELNLSGTIYIKLTPQTREFFKRFTHIKVDNHVWEVQVTDSISVPGILELEVQEYYDNPIADLPEIRKESEESVIVGETIVAQDSEVGYYIPKSYLKKNKEWKITGNPRVRLIDVLNNGNMCKVKIFSGAIGSYIISYGDYSLECTIDWQRNYIIGPNIIYPYSLVSYKAAGTFSVDSDLVKINNQNGKSCEIEVLTGRKGSFNLTCTTEDGDVYTLPVTIGSFTGGGNVQAVGVIS